MCGIPRVPPSLRLSLHVLDTAVHQRRGTQRMGDVHVDGTRRFFQGRNNRRRRPRVFQQAQVSQAARGRPSGDRGRDQNPGRIHGESNVFFWVCAILSRDEYVRSSQSVPKTWPQEVRYRIPPTFILSYYGGP